MQDGNRYSNKERSDRTRAALIDAARDMFVEGGFASTGTTQIVRRAGVTRGAMYHHFLDKMALFEAVVEAEWAKVATTVMSAGCQEDAFEALLAGGAAYLEAMAVPGRARLLLIDAPAVLGRPAVEEIESRHGGRTLEEGLRAAIASQQMRSLPVEALTRCLGAAYDRAVLAVADGRDASDEKVVLGALIDGLRCHSER
jgi:AcrR family transcriptional regulator